MSGHKRPPVEVTGLYLDFSDAPENELGHEVIPGNLYRNQVGDYWLVVSTSPNGAQILRYSQSGEIIGVTQYGKHHVAVKTYIGRVELPTLKVLWEPR